MGGMLGDLSHAELLMMRERDPRMQGMLAPFEHRAFAREWAQESPVLAGASLPFAIPLYSLAKTLGLQKARTPASLDEVFAGYHGYAEGMLGNVMPSAHAAAPSAGKREGSRSRIDGSFPPAPPPRRGTHSGGGVRG